MSVWGDGQKKIDYVAIGDRVIWTREEWERVAGPDAPPPFSFFTPIDLSPAHRWWEGEALEEEVRS